MAKVFNVDSLAEESRAIVLKGVEHTVYPMSVKSFLATMEIAETLEKDNTPESQVRAVVKMICTAIPSLTPQEVELLPVEQMNAISNFIRGEIPADLKAAGATVETVAGDVPAEGEATKN